MTQPGRRYLYSSLRAALLLGGAVLYAWVLERTGVLAPAQAGASALSLLADCAALLPLPAALGASLVIWTRASVQRLSAYSSWSRRLAALLLPAGMLWFPER